MPGRSQGADAAAPLQLVLVHRLAATLTLLPVGQLSEEAAPTLVCALLDLRSRHLVLLLLRVGPSDGEGGTRHAGTERAYSGELSGWRERR